MKAAGRPDVRRLDAILASPCHRAPLVKLAATRHRDRRTCAVCGRGFALGGAVGDLRLTPDGNGVGDSFDRQWRRYHRGDFERESLYGAGPESELEGFLGAFACGREDLRGRWILDAGCGSGRLAQSLGRLGANVVAIDLIDSLAMTGAANRLPNVHYLQADLMHPPFVPRSFDLVWSAGVLHHTGAPRRGLQRLAELVAPGGALAVWLYSARRFSPFLAMRTLMPWVRWLPERELMRLCRWLAVPLFVAGRFAPLWGRRAPGLATVRFGLYDSLSPRYQSRHSAAEVMEWFRGCGLVQCRVWGEVGVAGVKR